MAGSPFGEHRITVDSRGLAEVLQSQSMRRAMQVVADTALILFTIDVAKRSGRLAESGRAEVVQSDLTHDRWMAVLRVTAPYAVWHEWGAGPGMHPHSTGNMPKYGPFEGAYDFGQIVADMRSGGGIWG